MSREPTIETEWSDVGTDDARTGFWVSALLGALVSIVASFVPFSPVLGGGVAGYLYRGTREEGVKVGAVSGAIAAVPIVAVLTLVFAGLGLFTVLENALAGTLVFVALLGITVSVTLLLSAGLSALGGYVGVYLREETDGGEPPRTRDVPGEEADRERSSA